MKRILGSLVLAASCGVDPQAAGERAIVRIGVVFDGSRADEEAITGPASNLEAFQMFREEIRALTEREFDVRFPERKRLFGGWSTEGIRGALDRLLADPEVDLVLAVGVYATAAAGTRQDFPKPLVAPFGIDIRLENLPFVDGTSGVENFVYVSPPYDALRDLRQFRELFAFDRVHVIHDPFIAELLPNVYEYFEGAAELHGFEAIPVPAVDSATKALDALPPDAEAVYLTPLRRMPPHERGLFIEGLKQRRLPSFSLIGRVEVDLGVLAATAPESNVPRLARRVALNVQRILLGEDAGTLPVLLDRPERLVFNMETARAIRWFPTWEVLTRADRLHDEFRKVGERLSLSEAVLLAVENNLDLRATDRAVAAGAAQVERARSSFKPRLDFNATGLRIDSDRAAASFGSRAETTWSGSTSLSQILYSDATFSNVEIQRRLQESREHDRERVRLDVALDAAESFLSVLRAETLLEIQRENLRLTESNLSVAKSRQSLGVSGPAEVYRWESQLARDRRNVIAAEQRVSSARALLNRILSRPQEQPFVAVEPDIDHPGLVTGRGRLLPYVNNPLAFETFREFAVVEGLRAAPEVAALDAAIGAQERALRSSRRSFWSPDVRLFGDVEHRLSRSGAGADAPPGPLGVPSPDDTDWSLGVGLTLPLYTGGARAAGVRESQENLAALRLERDSTAEQVELRIRATLYDVADTYTAIEFNRESADASRKNLDLVRDLYSEGVVSIIDLLDAQNAALVSEQQAANSEYDFLIDLMESQRAMNNFDFFTSPEEREDWYGRLDRFFRETGIEPTGDSR